MGTLILDEDIVFTQGESSRVANTHVTRGRDHHQDLQQNIIVSPEKLSRLISAAVQKAVDEQIKSLHQIPKEL